jgi:hypothetical protein
MIHWGLGRFLMVSAVGIACACGMAPSIGLCAIPGSQSLFDDLMSLLESACSTQLVGISVLYIGRQSWTCIRMKSSHMSLMACPSRVHALSLSSLSTHLDQMKIPIFFFCPFFLSRRCVFIAV